MTKPWRRSAASFLSLFSGLGGASHVTKACRGRFAEDLSGTASEGADVIPPVWPKDLCFALSVLVAEEDTPLVTYTLQEADTTVVFILHFLKKYIFECKGGRGKEIEGKRRRDELRYPP